MTLQRPLDRVLDALAQRGCAAKRSGDNYAARCPAHEDRTPSLSVSAGDDGEAITAASASWRRRPDRVCTYTDRAGGDPLAAREMLRAALRKETA